MPLANWLPPTTNAPEGNRAPLASGVGGFASTRAVVEERSADVPFAELATAFERLSESYRSGNAPVSMSRIEALSYAVGRLPATHAAARAVFRELAVAAPRFGPTSQLDLGAGCGAVLLAARERLPGLLSQRGLDADEEMTLLAGALVGEGVVELQELCKWARTEPAERYDLVTAAYSLGELDRADGDAVVLAGWRASRGALVLIEAGTPDGFALIRRWRSLVIGEGGHVLAPCPHDDPCPMTDGDWCHVATRLQRSALQRRLKGGSAGYEDERFSYVALGRPEIAPAMGATTPRAARVIRHPWRAKGRVELTLCAPGGISKQTIRRNDPAYKPATRAEWGSVFDLPDGPSKPAEC